MHGPVPGGQAGPVDQVLQGLLGLPVGRRVGLGVLAHATPEKGLNEEKNGAETAFVQKRLGTR